MIALGSLFSLFSLSNMNFMRFIALVCFVLFKLFYLLTCTDTAITMLGCWSDNIIHGQLCVFRIEQESIYYFLYAMPISLVVTTTGLQL